VRSAIASAAQNAGTLADAADYQLHRMHVLALAVGVDADEQTQRRANAAADLAHAAMRDARRAGKLAKAAAEAAERARHGVADALATLDGTLPPTDDEHAAAVVRDGGL
jgi:hypothetical protein